MKDVNVMGKCSFFLSCSKNLCPLDSGLKLRNKLGGHECCKWIEGSRVRIKALMVDGHPKLFVTGQGIMPAELFKFVPESNYPYLNQATKEKYL